eukprot:7580843-Prorocentrum_lima.AAC.1
MPGKSSRADRTSPWPRRSSALVAATTELRRGLRRSLVPIAVKLMSADVTSPGMAMAIPSNL